MKGKIKVIDGIYPVTVDEAIYISGTNKTIKDKIEFSKYITKIKDKTSNLFDKDNIEINENSKKILFKEVLKRNYKNIKIYYEKFGLTKEGVPPPI